MRLLPIILIVSGCSNHVDYCPVEINDIVHHRETNRRAEVIAIAPESSWTANCKIAVDYGNRIEESVPNWYFIKLGEEL